MSLLDETISTGQSGHLTDHDRIAARVNKVLTPEEFGALGDNSHDDTSAIQAAHDALKALGGGRLEFQQGKSYLCASELDLSNTFNVTWRGAGGPSGSLPSKLVYSGAVGSRTFSNAASFTSGVTSVDVSGGDFTSADVGRTIRINNAGPNGNWLVTKITAVTDADTVVVSIPPSATSASQTAAVGGSFIKLANSDSNWFRNLRIDYSNASFLGDVIDMYSSSGSQSAYNRFDHVRISGADSSTTAAARLLNLGASLATTVNHCYFRYGFRAIQGSGDYCHIDQTRFTDLGVAAIWNLRQSCSVRRCTVTPCLTTDAVSLYDYDDTNSIKIVTFDDIWTGDGVSNAGTIIRFKGRYIAIGPGCQLTTADTAVDLVAGVVDAVARIDGYLSCTNGVKITKPASTNWGSIHGAPNNASTNKIVNPGNCNNLRLPIHGGGTPSLPKTIGVWTQENAAASQTDVALNLYGDTTRTGIPMVRAGSVTGVVVQSNAARTAGTLTVEVTIGGVKTGLTAALSGSSTTATAATQSPYLDTYTAGAMIGVNVTTTGTWTPTTADITVSVEVAE